MLAVALLAGQVQPKVCGRQWIPEVVRERTRHVVQPVALAFEFAALGLALALVADPTRH